MTLDLHSRNVLITGASSGIGHAMARRLGQQHGAHLFLVARRLAPMESLAAELSDMKVTCIQADLTLESDVQRVLNQAPSDLAAVILNAGVGYCGSALRQQSDNLDTMLKTNVLSTLTLARGLAPRLVEQQGALLFVSSLAGLSPTPWMAAYSGTKAFVTHYAESLAMELRPHGVSVTVFSPGGVATGMSDKSGSGRKFKNDSFVMMDPDRCARLGLQAMVNRRLHVVPGALNRLTALAMKLAPRRVRLFLAERTYRGAVLPEDLTSPKATG